MGGKNVKNTIVGRMLQIVAPHPCFGCGKIGTLLCDGCKFNIEVEGFHGCFVCGAASRDGICLSHNLPLERAWITGLRTGVLKKLINHYKFHNVKVAASDLADLLANTLPILPSSVVLVPIPTLASHRRQRGYDHIEVLIRHLSVRLELPIERLLVRTGHAVQHKLDKDDRHDAAMKSYKLAEGASLSKDKIYLIVDDVITTGATVSAAASILASEGSRVWAAALAYQALKK